MDLNSSNNLKPLLTTKEIRELLGISASTLWRYRQIKSFPKAMAINRKKIVFETKEILDWVRNQNKEAQTF